MQEPDSPLSAYTNCVFTQTVKQPVRYTDTDPATLYWYTRLIPVHRHRVEFKLCLCVMNSSDQQGFKEVSPQGGIARFKHK